MQKEKKKVTRKQKNKIKTGYEALMIIEDLLFEEKDENTIEKLKLLRKDVCRLVNINKQIDAKEGN